MQIIQEGLEGTLVRPGYIQFGGEGSQVQVPAKWLAMMSAKTRKAGPSHKLKKFRDGFFNPWDLQSVTGKSIESMTGDKKELFDALQRKHFFFQELKL